MQGSGQVRKFPISVMAVLLALVHAAPTRADDQVPPLQCDTGPLQRTYGGTEWVVYSCSDRNTVVIYTAAANPGKEFYFMFTSQKGELHLYGEGNGDKKYTNAAFEELKPMTREDVDALIKATELVKAPQTTDH